LEITETIGGVNMTELRRDPITREWVIIAGERSKRPGYLKKKEDKKAEEKTIQDETVNCPFCPGNENKTPPEIRVDPERKPANGPGWKVRVVANRYPALGIDKDFTDGVDRKLGQQKIGVNLAMEAYGAHEVIIESPDHNILFEDQPIEQLELILNRFKERLTDLYLNRKMKQFFLFKNHGKEAGASLNHPHSQLMTYAVVPDELKKELNGAKEYYEKERSCIWCAILDQNWMDLIKKDPDTGEPLQTDPFEERMVLKNQSFVVLCPFASIYPYEMHIIPRRHSHFYGNINFQEIKDLAITFKTVIKKLNKALQDIHSESAPYNLALHTSPNLTFREDDPAKFRTIKEDSHWHFEIYPVGVATPGTVERGKGIPINSYSPEFAAKELREAQIEENK